MPTPALAPKARAVKAPVPIGVKPPSPFSRIVAKIPRPSPQELQAAGKYRVIHGSIEVPLPKEMWQRLDGSEIDGAPKTERAIPGDIVDLNAEDATRMLAHDIVEDVDAKPSRLNAVWKPPTSKFDPFGQAKVLGGKIPTEFHPQNA